MNTMGWGWGGVDQSWLRVKMCMSLITRDPFHSMMKQRML